MNVPWWVALGEGLRDGMCGTEITIKSLIDLKPLRTAPANVKRALKVVHERNAAKRNA